MGRGEEPRSPSPAPRQSLEPKGGLLAGFEEWRVSWHLPAQELCLRGASGLNHVSIWPWPRRVQGTLECQRVRARRHIRAGPAGRLPITPGLLWPPRSHLSVEGLLTVLLWAQARAGPAGRGTREDPLPRSVLRLEGALPADREVRASGRRRALPEERRTSALLVLPPRSCSSAGVWGSVPRSRSPARRHWGRRERREGVGRARPWGGASFLRSRAAGPSVLTGRLIAACCIHN